MTDLIIDALSEPAVELASLVWKKDRAETWGIISRAIQAQELKQQLSLIEFQEYIQLKARPKFFSHCPVCGMETPPTTSQCPACNVNLEIARNNVIKDMALEFFKFGFILGQQSAQTPPPPKASKQLTLSSVIGWAFFCFFLLLAYGWVKDMYMPTYIQQPTLLPSPKINPTKTAQPTDSCLLWSQVTAQMEGRTVCVYGTVIEYRENWENFIANIYFGTREDFYIVSNYRWDDSPVGECLTATGKIQLNTYKIPYIKIQDRLDFCQ